MKDIELENINDSVDYQALGDRQLHLLRDDATTIGERLGDTTEPTELTRTVPGTELTSRDTLSLAGAAVVLRHELLDVQGQVTESTVIKAEGEVVSVQQGDTWTPLTPDENPDSYGDIVQAGRLFAGAAFLLR